MRRTSYNIFRWNVGTIHTRSEIQRVFRRRAQTTEGLPAAPTATTPPAPMQARRYQTPPEFVPLVFGLLAASQRHTPGEGAGQWTLPGFPHYRTAIGHSGRISLAIAHDERAVRCAASDLEALQQALAAHRYPYDAFVTETMRGDETAYHTSSEVLAVASGPGRRGSLRLRVQPNT